MKKVRKIKKRRPAKWVAALGILAFLLCLPMAGIGAAWIIFQIFATQNAFFVCLLAIFLCSILGYEAYFLFQFYTE